MSQDDLFNAHLDSHFSPRRAIKPVNEQKTYNLFLDDTRSPQNDKTWDVVRTHAEFIRTIERRGMPSLISFDHDLGEKKSGYDCAKWLIEYCMKTSKELPEYRVHSQNPVGKANIRALLENYKQKIENVD
jgi:hypothetical protein